MKVKISQTFKIRFWVADEKLLVCILFWPTSSSSSSLSQSSSLSLGCSALARTTLSKKLFRFDRLNFETTLILYPCRTWVFHVVILLHGRHYSLPSWFVQVPYCRCKFLLYRRTGYKSSDVSFPVVHWSTRQTKPKSFLSMPQLFS